MTIKDILVHVDDSARRPSPPRPRPRARRSRSAPGSPRCYLIAEPFMSGASRHAPADVIHEHLAHWLTRRRTRFSPAWPLMPSTAASASASSRRAARSTGCPVFWPATPATAILSSSVSPIPRRAAATTRCSSRPPSWRPGGRRWCSRMAAAPRRPVRPRDGRLERLSRGVARGARRAAAARQAAKEVVILVIDPDDIGATLGRQPGSGVARHLEHHGASVRVKTVESGRRRAGEVILSEATARGRRSAGDGRLRPLEAPRGAARRRDPNAARRRDATDPAFALTARSGAPQKSPGRLIRNAQPP